MRFYAGNKEYWYTVQDPIHKRNIGGDCESLGEALELAIKHVDRFAKTERLYIGHCESSGGRGSYGTTFLLEVFHKDGGVMVQNIKEAK